MDSRMKVNWLARTPNPQQVIWASAHQCVCDGSLEGVNIPPEEAAGHYVVRHLLAGNRGHYSPLEAPAISFNVIGFPHSTMQQIRTHRVGVHFSVQSFRYTSGKILEIAQALAVAPREPGFIQEIVEDAFYLRSPGFYTSRSGKRYTYTAEQRLEDLEHCLDAAKLYAKRVEEGFAEEHARSLIPFDVRQNWVMTVNVRSLMHILDLRAKEDAQLECCWLANELLRHLRDWTPALAEWYVENRFKRARLSP
jgi:thymidylate synthase (FAD)